MQFVTSPNFSLMTGVVLFLGFDTLIAFKSTLLYCFGLYLMVLLKVTYQSPRPFWVQGDVKVLNDNCEFNFASPSTHIFDVVFFWNYNIYMYLVYYKQTPNRLVVGLAYTFSGLMTVGVIVLQFLMGQVYLY